MPIPLSQAVVGKRMIRKSTCVNCWHEFSPDEVLWISEHDSLLGEPRIGDYSKSKQRRFIGERFDTVGKAIDAAGSPCTTLACPRCLLSIPEDSIEITPLIFSILGSPGSGKSVLLAAMAHQLRLAGLRMGLGFADADPILNKHLIEDEQRMFYQGVPEKWRDIKAIISKTETIEARWRETQIDGGPARFVPPYTFRVAPAESHPRAEKAADLTTLICLYDNAGEHFSPGARDAGMTLHLTRSQGMLYCFDPTSDIRVMAALKKKNEAITQRGAGERQDTVLAEAAARIRRDTRLGAREKIKKPIVMVLPKLDVWEGLLSEYMPNFRKRDLLANYPARGIRGLAEDAIEDISNACKTMLRQVCPDPLAAAEALSEVVYCIPVSAVGANVRFANGQYQVQDPIQPEWTEIPLLLLMKLGEDNDRTKPYPRGLVPVLRPAR
jgi:hypothetical protein